MFSIQSQMKTSTLKNGMQVCCLTCFVFKMGWVTSGRAGKCTLLKLEEMLQFVEKGVQVIAVDCVAQRNTTYQIFTAGTIHVYKSSSLLVLVFSLKVLTIKI